MALIKQETIAALDARIGMAEARYGAFASTHEAMGVALEEWDELREAIKSNKMSSIEWECLDLAAVLIRLAENINHVALRSTK